MKITRALKSGLYAAVASFFMAGAAQAMPIFISEWEINAEAVFVNPVSPEFNQISDGGAVLAWGADAPSTDRSYLVISDQNYDPSMDSAPYDGSTTSIVTGIMTDGGPQPAGSITHFNFPIDDGTGLNSVTINDKVSLKAVSPNAIDFGTFEFDFNVVFEETPNTASGCIPESISECDDIFVLLNPEVLSFSFIFDMYKYTVSFGLGLVDTLSDEACSAVGQSSGCIGFITQENTFTQRIGNVEITSMMVSEPEILALLGLSLVGIGLARRRRQG